MKRNNVIAGTVVGSTIVLGLLLSQVYIPGMYWLDTGFCTLAAVGRIMIFVSERREREYEENLSVQVSEKLSTNRQMRRHPDGLNNRDFGHPQGKLAKSNRVIKVHHG